MRREEALVGKIALVLSGGVAKGAYEVGVLQALAEAKVVPDVMVGISAGALNGAVMSGLIADEGFTVDAVREGLADIWREQVSFSHFFQAFDGEDAFTDLERKSLNNLLMRFGIDPFGRQLLPTRIDPSALATLENILRGRFMSLFNHAHLRRLSRDFSFPEQVKREIRFSAVTCNLMGGTSLNEQAERIDTAWTHHEDFRWYPGMPRTENFIEFSRLIDAILASSSFPLAFTPMRMTLQGADRPGLFIDGAMSDHAPLGKAIAMHPEVDVVIVVMATTIVPPLTEEPNDIMKVFSRLCEMLAGKFIINNYQQVQKVNRRLIALHELLEKDSDGRLKESAFNQKLALASGFGTLEKLAQLRVVNVLPIIPSTPLEGDLFGAFSDKRVLARYIDQGLADARSVLAKRWPMAAPMKF